MYTSHFSTQITLKSLSNTLCGSPQSRGPGHFIGVATVVAKLFNIVRPKKAYFGLKDFQQLRIIEKMNSDLNLDVKVVKCPTIRAKGGVAHSSRNSYLTLEDQANSHKLYIALQYGRKLLRSRPKLSPNKVIRKVKSTLNKIPHAKIDYIELVDPITLQKVITSSRRPVLLAAAIKFRAARLIDNLLIR